ncbi:MAG: hypothetical protein KKA07_01005 [Bacteroidetes bacterium]|nr:hypothetical protein [Bacteroidota bacterium]MBU1717626.1 hypothetical protein [Bacteroidota bacterium]
MISELNARQLFEFVNSSEYEKLRHLPTTPLRALSLLNSPNGHEEQIIMLLYYENEKFCGYLGAVPDVIYSQGIKIHVAWMSCMWIDSSQRGKGIAVDLIKKLSELWEGKLLVSNWIPASKAVFDKTGIFEPLANLDGKRFYLRMCMQDILPQKKKIFKVFLPVLKTGDFIINSLRDPLVIKRYKHIDLRNVLFLDHCDEESRQFLAEKADETISKRNGAFFKWVLDYPWVKVSKRKDSIASRYIFSYIEKRFHQFFMKLISDNGRLVALAFLTIKGNHMKTPYVFVEKADYRRVAEAILRTARINKISVLTTYDSKLAKAISEVNHKSLKTKDMVFGMLVSKTLVSSGATFTPDQIREGEGDYSFT